jgi:hypothetical protein
MSRMDNNSTGGVNFDPYARHGWTLTALVGNPLDEFPVSLKNWWCGWDSLPPGFLPPVKGQVACMEPCILWTFQSLVST